MKFKKFLLNLILFIFLALFLYSAFSLVKWFIDTNNSKKLISSILSSTKISELDDSGTTELINPPESKDDPYWEYVKTKFLNVDFSSLLNQNKETVGWIRVNNTVINYPVVQAEDNSKYLAKSFDGSSNKAGWIFADYRLNFDGNDKNTIIYGHNMKDNSMFSTLNNVLSKDWYENKANHTIQFSTPTENTVWQVFSVYKIEPEEYYITTSFENEKTYENFLNIIKSRSIYDFKTNLSINDKILTLSTCNTSGSKYRTVLHAKLIKRQNRK